MYLNVFISLFSSLSSSMSSSVCCRLTLKKNRKIDITLQDYTEQCFFFIDSCKYKRPPYIHYRLAQYKCTVFTTHVCRIPRTPLLQCAPHFVPISKVFIDWRFSCHVRKNYLLSRSELFLADSLSRLCFYDGILRKGKTFKMAIFFLLR